MVINSVGNLVVLLVIWADNLYNPRLYLLYSIEQNCIEKNLFSFYRKPIPNTTFTTVSQGQENIKKGNIMSLYIWTQRTPLFNIYKLKFFSVLLNMNILIL